MRDAFEIDDVVGMRCLVVVATALAACGFERPEDVEDEFDAVVADAPPSDARPPDANPCPAVPALDGPILAYWPFEDSLIDQVEARSLVSMGAASTFVDRGACRAVRLTDGWLSRNTDDAAFDFQQAPFSIALWAYFEEAPADPNLSTVISKTSDGNASTDGFSLFRHANGLVYFCYDTGVSGSCGSTQSPDSLVLSTTTAQTATWYHITIVRSPPITGVTNGEVELWIDGVLENENGLDMNSLVDTPAPLQIGLAGTDANSLFRGRIDDVLIVGRVLTADEIALLATR